MSPVDAGSIATLDPGDALTRLVHGHLVESRGVAVIAAADPYADRLVMPDDDRPSQRFASQAIRAALAERVTTASQVKGDFLLRSGQRSDLYFDKYQFESDPVLLRDLADAMVTLVPEGTEVLAGLELGGVPLATALSLRTGLPSAFVRKQAKTHGTCRLAEGADVDGRKVCVVEDVITTGGQVLESVAALREAGAQVLGVVCVLWRAAPGQDRLAEAGLPWSAVLGLDDVAPFISST